jgi:hypothetical protein
MARMDLVDRIREGIYRRSGVPAYDRNRTLRKVSKRVRV